MNHDNIGIQAWLMRSASSPIEKPVFSTEENEKFKKMYMKVTHRTEDIFITLCEYYDISKETGFAWLVENWREYTLEQIHKKNPDAEGLCYG